jgi:hypothetical protein
MMGRTIALDNPCRFLLLVAIIVSFIFSLSYNSLFLKKQADLTFLDVLLTKKDVAHHRSFSPKSRNDEKYLFYFSHSGWGNQLMGVERAAQFAYATNRTLVLPPVLPHSSDYNSTKRFPEWKWRVAIGGGSRNRPLKEFQEFQQLARDDALQASAKLVSSTRNFPSFQEVIDFSELTAASGLHVVDLSDFMTVTTTGGYHNVSTDTWCEGGSWVKKWLSNGEMEKYTYKEWVQVFQQRMQHQDGQQTHTSADVGAVVTKDCRVAVIGSAFFSWDALQNDFSTFDKNASRVFHNFFSGFPMSRTFLTVLRKVYAKLLPSSSSNKYIGVHIRLKDKSKFPCGDKDGTRYKKVADRILAQTVNATVLIGCGVNAKAKDCLQSSLLSNKYQAPVVHTVNDLLNGDEEIIRLIESIELEKTTLFLLLDLILIALADRVELESHYKFESTFQVLIDRRHDFRSKTLEEMDSNDLY